MKLSCILTSLLVLSPLGTRAVMGQITSVGPFTGTHSDYFNNIGSGGAGGHQQVTIFNGFASVINTTSGGALKIEFSSSLNGDLVSPRSPPVFLGQLGISKWIFNSPVTQIGGYWENNSRFDDATVRFFDASDNLIGAVNAIDPHLAQTWTWNGWHSTVPFSSMTVTGNDTVFLSGFIWWEDFQVIAAVPEPGTYALVGIAGVIAGYCAYRRWRGVRMAREMSIG